MIGPQVFWDALSGVARWVRKRVDERTREWALWASTNPEAAAEFLDSLATEAFSRAQSFRRQNGWRARIWHARARNIRLQAADLRSRARGAECSADPYRKPGT